MDSINLLLNTNLACLLQLKGLTWLVTHFGRAKILDRARVNVIGVDCPLVALAYEVGERCTFQFHQSFLNYRLHLSMPSLHVHHHGYGHTSGDPLSRGSGSISHR